MDGLNFTPMYFRHGECHGRCRTRRNNGRKKTPGLLLGLEEDMSGAGQGPARESSITQPILPQAHLASTSAQSLLNITLTSPYIRFFPAPGLTVTKLHSYPPRDLHC